MRFVSLSELRHRPLPKLIRDIEARLESVLAPHRVGDPYPQVTVVDYSEIAEAMSRMYHEFHEEHER